MRNWRKHRVQLSFHKGWLCPKVRAVTSLVPFRSGARGHVTWSVSSTSGSRFTCYDGYELIFTNDNFTNGIFQAADAYPYPVGQCRLCPAGTATMDGFRCIPCPSGYWSEAGARECTACPPGTIPKPTTPTAGSTYPQILKLNQGPQASVCKSCPPGYFQPNLAGTVCIPCPSGKLSGS